MSNWLKLILRCAAVVLVLGLAGVSGASAASENRFSLPESPLFSCPAPLRPQVDFWIKIFTLYTTKQAVIHDNRYLNIIYSVVDLTEDQSNSKKARIGVLSFEISKYREILLKLDKLKPDDPDEINNLSPEESRVYEMFRGIEGANKFSEAADRLRAQIGQKDRFQKALSKSTLYLKEMERIFREEGVPVALTRLPFVESSFDVSAYSWAKAAGIWQFTDSTGRIFLRMNSIVDERIDPEKSTRAAARLLLDNYAQLGSWPLAVTAYNHGASGLSRAKKDLSTSDISEIVEKYKGPSFGFASRNYYTEFLAVLEILEDYQSYFGDVEFMYPKEYEVLRTGRSMKVSAIAAACSLEEIRRLNPELKPSVMASKTSLPCDYFLKLPPGTKDSLKSQVKTETPPPQAKPSTQTRKTDIASKSDASKKKEPQPGKAIHIKPGAPLTASIPKTGTKPKADTAKKPETSQSAPPKIEKKPPVATVAEKPTPDPKGDAKKSTPKPQIARHHKVITGQNLFSIAKMYNVSVKDLMKLNSIGDPSKVRPGRVLQIPEKS
ncbi:transglycosylase SLT domain-containing protein [Candidatus Magnetominusculus dajiuhuensis]|uniref:lytic transglycosylase domain-containing protein n=1 Tax=Candidatus Magnetominusculus dajiuhuensis TaxID=3137712 RepID=UPI003B43812A